MKVTYVYFFVLFIGCTAPKPEATEERKPEIISLLGKEYFAPTPVNPKLDSNLLLAQKNFANDSSEENYIWLGRRTAYLTRYNEAME